MKRIRYQNILCEKDKISEYFIPPQQRSEEYKKNNSYFRLWVDLDKKNPSSFIA